MDSKDDGSDDEKVVDDDDGDALGRYCKDDLPLDEDDSKEERDADDKVEDAVEYTVQHDLLSFRCRWQQEVVR